MAIISKKNLKKFILVTIFLVGIFLLSQYSRVHQPANIKIVKIAHINVVVDVATEEAQKAQGLSGRKSLGKDEGMLFVFDHLDKYSFWMKDMNFPIDIIWFNQNLKVVHIEKSLKPESYPESFAPDQNAKYVLEVVAGFSDQFNLKVGDSASFVY